MNNKALTISLLILGVLLAALICRNGDLAWMAIPLLVYLGTGVYQSPPSEQVQLKVEREVKQIKTNGISGIEMHIKVSNQGDRPLHIKLAENLKTEVKITGGFLNYQFTLNPGSETEQIYTFQAQRGSFSWKTIQAIVSDRPYVNSQ